MSDLTHVVVLIAGMVLAGAMFRLPEILRAFGWTVQ
jgi:hypothetical protein